MQDIKYNLNDHNLKKCPFCGGVLRMYIHDDTGSKYVSKAYPMWEGGATCQDCGIGIQTGFYGWGNDVDEIEKMIIMKLNKRIGN